MAQGSLPPTSRLSERSLSSSFLLVFLFILWFLVDRQSELVLGRG